MLFRGNKRQFLPTAYIAAIVILAGSTPESSAAGQGLLSGKVALDNERRLLTAIHWQTSFKGAEAEAQRTHKMIFWVQMHGRIDGVT